MNALQRLIVTRTRRIITTTLILKMIHIIIQGIIKCADADMVVSMSNTK